MFDFLLDAQAKGLLDEQHYGSGRGIVFSAGNSDTFERVRACIPSHSETMAHIQTHRCSSPCVSCEGSTTPTCRSKSSASPAKTALSTSGLKLQRSGALFAPSPAYTRTLPV